MRLILRSLALLAIPVLLSADITNTALVSFIDGLGSHMAQSNTVTIIVSAPPVDLPTPDVSSLDGKTFTLNDTLSLAYNGDATGFNWEFDPLTAESSNKGFPSNRASAAAGTATLKTQAPRLSFGDLNLETGLFTLKVQASNGGQTSAWAAATITLVGANLSSIHVYPNPWRKDKHDGKPITFDQLTGSVTLKIFTVSGHLVKTLGPQSGAIIWNLTTDSGDSVAAGLYLYQAADSQGNKTRGKLAVIR